MRSRNLMRSIAGRCTTIFFFSWRMDLKPFFLARAIQCFRGFVNCATGSDQKERSVRQLLDLLRTVRNDTFACPLRPDIWLRSFPGNSKMEAEYARRAAYLNGRLTDHKPSVPTTISNTFTHSPRSIQDDYTRFCCVLCYCIWPFCGISRILPFLPLHRWYRFLPIRPSRHLSFITCSL